MWTVSGKGQSVNRKKNWAGHVQFDYKDHSIPNIPLSTYEYSAGWDTSLQKWEFMSNAYCCIINYH